MAKGKKKPASVASAYSRIRKRIKGRELSADEARQAAEELGRFGLEADRFIRRKLEEAGPEELRTVLSLVRHFDNTDIGEGLRELIESRAVPLSLKLECFEVMTELGHSLGGDLLEQLHEAEETYHQLATQLRKGGEGSSRRIQALADDVMALPARLRLSFLMQLQEEWTDQALPFVRSVAGRDSEVDSLLINAISGTESPEAAEALLRIAEGSSKEAARKARRALYRLRQKGLVSEEEDEGKREETAVSEEEQAFASNIDTFGSRLIVLAVPGLREILACQGTINDEAGLVGFSAAEMPRKSYRGYLKELREEVERDEFSSLVQIDSAHCRWLLEQAYQQSQRTGTLIPESYKSLRYRLKAPEGYNPRSITSSLLEPSGEGVRFVASMLEEVFAMPEVGIWMIEKGKLIPYAQRYIEMAESKLVLNEQQRRARLEDALSDFTAEYFSEESGRLEQMVRRLEETAYILSRKGQSEKARLLAGLAKDVEGSSFLQPHIFLQNFMMRSIAGTIQALQEEEKRRSGPGTGGVIKPGGARGPA
jgi:hypothetical protein